MLGILIRKQMTELYRSFFYDQKKNKARSKAASILFIILYILLMAVVLGGMFTLMSLALCPPLLEAGLGWLYFTIVTAIAFALGIFGSVFSTYSALYLAKDNDLLLSLPIPVRYILAARLMGVYLIGLSFSAIVIIPAVIVYNILAGVTVTSVFGGIMLLVSVSLFVLVLSCLLGWVVAKVSVKLKNKSFVTVLISLVFFGLYYFVYFKASEVLQRIIENAATIGDKIKGAAYPLYVIGRSGEGDPLSVVLFFAVTAVVLALVLLIIARGFIKIATTNTGSAKVRYKEKTAKKNSIFGAILGKEFSRFTSSPNYMLNCGFGIIFLLAATVFIFIKGDAIAQSLTLVSDQVDVLRILPVLFCALVCALSSMNYSAVPSVSLEGKNIWIIQSLPADPWLALKAKFSVQAILTAVPAAICTIAFIIKTKTDILSAIVSVLFIAVYIVFYSLFCLYLGIKKPNLTWTSEIYPIKQSGGIFIALLVGCILPLILGIGYLFVFAFVGAPVYLLVWLVPIATLSVALYRYLQTKGTQIFASL